MSKPITNYRVGGKKGGFWSKTPVWWEKAEVFAGYQFDDANVQLGAITHQFYDVNDPDDVLCINEGTLCIKIVEQRIK